MKFRLAGFTVASCEGNRAFAEVIVHATDAASVVQTRRALAAINLGRAVLPRVSVGAFASEPIVRQASDFVMYN